MVPNAHRVQHWPGAVRTQEGEGGVGGIDGGRQKGPWNTHRRKVDCRAQTRMM